MPRYDSVFSQIEKDNQEKAKKYRYVKDSQDQLDQYWQGAFRGTFIKALVQHLQKPSLNKPFKVAAFTQKTLRTLWNMGMAGGVTGAEKEMQEITQQSNSIEFSLDFADEDSLRLDQQAILKDATIRENRFLSGLQKNEEGGNVIDETEVRERIRTLESVYPAIGGNSIFSEYLTARTQTAARNFDVIAERQVKQLTKDYLELRDPQKIEARIFANIEKENPNLSREQKQQIRLALKNKIGEKVKDLKIPGISPQSQGTVNRINREHLVASSAEGYVSGLVNIQADSKQKVRMELAAVQRLAREKAKSEKYLARVARQRDSITSGSSNSGMRADAYGRAMEVAAYLKEEPAGGLDKNNRRQFSADQMKKFREIAGVVDLPANQRRSFYLKNSLPGRLVTFLEEESDPEIRVQPSKIAQAETSLNQAKAQRTKILTALAKDRDSRQLRDRLEKIDQKIDSRTEKLSGLRSKVKEYDRILAGKESGGRPKPPADELIPIPQALREKVAAITYRNPRAYEKVPAAATWEQIETIKREVYSPDFDRDNPLQSVLNDAYRLGATEISAAYNIGRMKVFADNEVKILEAVAVMDSSTSVFCQSLNGKLFSMSDFAELTQAQTFPNTRKPEFDLKNLPIAPRSRVSGAGVWQFPAHPYAYLPDTQVVSIQPELIMRKRYQGRIILLVTEDGNGLSITGEHPILTQRGFIRADHLTPSDYIFDTFYGERTVFCNPDYRHSIPTVEELFHLSNVSSSLVGGTVPVPTEDLDSKVTQHKIDIKGANRDLLERDKTQCSQVCQEDFFQSANVGLMAESAHGAQPTVFTSPLTRQPGIVSLTGHVPTLGGTLPSIEDLMAAGEVTDVLTLFSQNSFYNTGVYLQLLSQYSPRQPHFVTRDNQTGQGKRKDLFSADGQNLTVRARKLTQVLSKEYEGFVYHVQDATGINVANGIISHNCRSFYRPIASKDLVEQYGLKQKLTEETARKELLSQEAKRRSKIGRQKQNAAGISAQSQDLFQQIQKEKLGTGKPSKARGKLIEKTLSRANKLRSVASFASTFNTGLDLLRQMIEKKSPAEESSPTDSRKTESAIAKALLLGGTVLAGGALYYFFSKSNLADSIRDYLVDASVDVGEKAAAQIVQKILENPTKASAEEALDLKARIGEKIEDLSLQQMAEQAEGLQMALDPEGNILDLERLVRTFDPIAKPGPALPMTAAERQRFDSIMGALIDNLGGLEKNIFDTAARAISRTSPNVYIKPGEIRAININPKTPNVVNILYGKGQGQRGGAATFASKKAFSTPEYKQAANVIRKEAQTLDNQIRQMEALLERETGAIEGAFRRKTIRDLRKKINELKGYSNTLKLASKPIPKGKRLKVKAPTEVELRRDALIENREDELDAIRSQYLNSQDTFERLTREFGVSEGMTARVLASGDKTLSRKYKDQIARMILELEDTLYNRIGQPKDPLQGISLRTNLDETLKGLAEMGYSNGTYNETIERLKEDYYQSIRGKIEELQSTLKTLENNK